MNFKTLKEKMEYYRSLTDYKLMPGTYTLVMVDGHNFSRKVKNTFDKPFCDVFANLMNQTAIKICKEFQGVKFAYTQSDEISLLMTDFDGADSSYGYRLCKLQSLIASEATGEFNRCLVEHLLQSSKDIQEYYKNGAYTFDCKVWQVPKESDVNGWFIYRQNDCIRNSVSQLAQNYFSHHELLGKNVDEMKELVKTKNVDWENLRNGFKYGRIIKKENVTKFTESGEPFNRGVWKVEEQGGRFEEEIYGLL